jgi:hypothetical protein
MLKVATLTKLGKLKTQDSNELELHIRAFDNINLTIASNSFMLKSAAWQQTTFASEKNY